MTAGPLVDVLFVAHNRLEFTRASFSAMVENTDWSMVARLHVVDDVSSDGTSEWLAGQDGRVPVPLSLTRRAFGGPVAAMNHAVDRCESELLAKVDSDLVVCPGWLGTLVDVIGSAPGLDVLGLEPGFGAPVEPVGVARSVLPAAHVGGIGMIRTRVFRRALLRGNGRWFGWTDYQRRHAECGWVTPDLPCFLLDHLPFEPWQSLAAGYVEKGWQRAWPPYSDEMAGYWAWWTDAQAAAA